MKKNIAAIIILLLIVISCKKSRDDAAIESYKEALSAIKEFNSVLTGILKQGKLTRDMGERFKSAFSKMKENMHKYETMGSISDYPEIKEELTGLFNEITKYAMKNLLMLRRIINFPGVKHLVGSISGGSRR